MYLSTFLCLNSATGRVLRLWVVEVNILDGKESCDRDSLTVMEGTATSMDASHVLAVLCGKLFLT